MTTALQAIIPPLALLVGFWIGHRIGFRDGIQWSAQEREGKEPNQ